MKLFMLYLNIFIIIITIKNSFSQKSKAFPLYKILLAENMTTLHLNSNGIRNLHIYTKGTGIIFDNNSDINAIPKHIFREIKTFYFEYQNIIYFETKYKDNYVLLLLSDFYSQLEVLHFILEDKGITFPVEELFRPMENDSRFLFDFYGYENEDEDNIVIGKDLIKRMNIEFNDNGFVINNEKFVLKEES